ncbi:MAG TPA: hypothetical protein VGD05_02250 [Pyrinomonadaceae bacterium]
MQNIVEFEKHPDGMQVYVNEKPFAWHEDWQTAPKDVHYIEQFKAEIIRTTAEVKTRHFRIDDNFSLEEWKIFLEQLSKVIISGEYFRAGFQYKYFTLRGIYSSRENIEQIEDVFFRYRHKFFQKIELKQKPKPQKFWEGEWVNIKAILASGNK